ncbi:MAG: cadherin-like domain-containing protein, partial [Gammaproteobacteria bacterium]|nr:cadherin-like domain-containing protein [Gammaproteobacteria bacterium]
MALELKIVTNDGKVQTIQPGRDAHIAVKPGMVIVVEPGDSLELTTARQGDDLVVHTPEGSFVLTGFFAVLPPEAMPPAISFVDESGFKFLGAGDSDLIGAFDLPAFDGAGASELKQGFERKGLVPPPLLDSALTPPEADQHGAASSSAYREALDAQGLPGTGSGGTPENPPPAPGRTAGTPGAGHDPDADAIATQAALLGPTNAAPILEPVPVTLVATTEDVQSDPITVAALLASATDTDAGALHGIALTAAAGHGTWLYSLDGGANFAAVGTVGNASALLLPDDAVLRYLPDQQNGETATLSYRAWDQTSGKAGEKVSATANGGNSAFSADTNTASLTVHPVNDAPTAGDDTASTTFQSTTIISVLPNDADVDTGDVLSIGEIDGNAATVGVPVVLASGALATLNADGTITYDPNGQFDALVPPASAVDTFSYTIHDLGGGTATAAVAVTVNAFNTPADATNTSQVLAYTEGDPAVALTPIVITDPDNGSTITATLTLADPATGAISTGTFGSVTSTYNPGTGVWQAVGGVADVNAALGAAAFQPAPDNDLNTTITVNIRDNANTGPADGTIALNVTAVNDAPVLAAASPVLTATDEDTTSAFTVASLLGSDLSDVDTGALAGIAVTALTGNGTWEFSTNGGTSWGPVGAVAGTNALLLGASDMLRYVPDAQNGETATLSYRGWDQTSGTIGNKVDASTSTGGSTAFSTGSNTASLTVASVNDAPELAAASPTLTTTDENTTSTGTLVSALVGATISDVDGAAAQGIAISATTGNGTWQFSTNAGGTWAAVGAVSGTSALLLRTTDLVRYVPDNQNGETATFTYQAWDRTTGTQGTKVDASTAGGTSAFSSATDTASLVVTAVNDAPAAVGDSASVNQLSTGQTIAVLANDTDVDSGDTKTITAINGGAVVIGNPITLASGAIVTVNVDGTVTYDPNGQFVVVAPATASDSFTYTMEDAAHVTSTATVNVTITSNFAPVIGTHVYTAGSGAAAGTGEDTAMSVTAANGVLLGNTAGLVPDSDVDGPNALVIVAGATTSAQGASVTLNADGSFSYDPTGAAALQALAAGATLDDTFTYQVTDGVGGGGPTTGTVTVRVTGANDAPVLDATKSPVLVAEAEDSVAPVGAVGTLVSALADKGGALSNVSDADGGSLTGLAITAADTTNGAWFFTTDGGTTWTALGAVSATGARLLAADANTRLYFQPTANFNGAITSAITFKAWDQTSGTNGTLVNPGAGGGTTAFSTATDTASLSITAVNDAPLLAAASPALTAVNENTTTAGTLVSTLLGGTLTDVDSAPQQGIAITTTAGNGTWQYSTNGGTTYNAIGAVTGTSALLLRATDLIRYVPDSSNGETATFSYRGWDQSGGAFG